VDSWSRWLIELHRLLKPGGLLYVTFMGKGTSHLIAGEAWDEEKVGMNVLKYGQSWDIGGPMVMHSPWWIREHWWRAFEILSLEPEGFGGVTAFSHGSVLMRKSDKYVSTGLLEQISADEERESSALVHNLEQTRAEVAGLRADLESIGVKDESLRRLEVHVTAVERQLVILENSRSWNLTRPLRSIGKQIRAVRRVIVDR
jgi:hypothetical protein